MAESKTEEQPVLKEAKLRRFPCKGCGADLSFEPGKNDLVCPHCGYKEKIPQTEQEIREYSFNDYLHKPKSTGYGRKTGEARDIRCQSCGATSHLDASVRATKCPFCGGALIADDAGAGNVEDDDVITPEAVLPFKVTGEQAQAAFRKWIQGLWFAPSALRHETHLSQLQGIYRPYWTYDSQTVSHWTGERGDHYWETEAYTEVVDGKSVTRTRQVQRTRWSYCSGIYSEFFDDVLVKAGNNTDHITNYNLAELAHYTPEYLSGFVAERYVTTCEEGWVTAKSIMGGEIRSGVCGQIGGDEQRVSSVNTAYSGVSYKHILLPLWLSCYRYHGKTYCFQVNGQSGETAGARPYSFWKIFTLVVSILAAIAIIVLLASGQKH